MTLQPELMNAILSMDSYNRGYEAGIVFGNNSGTNNYSLDSTGTQIGNATITINSQIFQESGDRVDDDIGFYALAYQIKDSSGNVVDNVIAYRGTDGPNPIPDDSDVTNGWLLGAGNYNATQGTMAVNFYKEVAKQIGGADVDLQAVNISTTGHSLGGGFAGFIAVNDNNQGIRTAA